MLQRWVGLKAVIEVYQQLAPQQADVHVRRTELVKVEGLAVEANMGPTGMALSQPVFG